MDIATPTDTNLIHLKLQGTRRTVQPEHDLMLWAHDEIVRLRAAADALRELHTILDFEEGWNSCHCIPDGRAMNLACEKAYTSIELLRATDRVSP